MFLAVTISPVSPKLRIWNGVFTLFESTVPAVTVLF